MKHLLFTIALGLFFQGASAQKSADVLLDNVSAKISKSGGLKADFALKILMPNGKVKENRSGSLSSKGSSFSIKMGANEIYCDGKTIWNLNKTNKEVQINDYDPAETTISPEKLFSSTFKKDYNYSYVGMRVMKGVKYSVVRLFPKNKTNEFVKVDLVINPATSMIYKGYVTDKGKNMYVYTLSSVKFNQTFDASAFTYNVDAHPGMTVLDLR